MVTAPKTTSVNTEVTFESTSRIPKQAPSPIIIGVLDNAIQAALEPLLMHTSIVQSAMCQLGAQFCQEAPRFTTEPFADVFPHLVEAVKRKSYAAYRRAKVDRSTSLSMVTYFMDSVEKHLGEEGGDVSESLSSFCKSIACPEKDVFWLYRLVKDYYGVARFMVDEIFKRYMKKSWKEAGKKVELSGQNLDVTHVYPNLILGVQQGLDRCCVDKGNLTASVQNFQRVWANHKRYGAAYGVACTMGQAKTHSQANEDQHDTVNFSVALEDVNETAFASHQDTPITGRILSGMAHVEGTAIALLANNLLPQLTEEQKSVLRRGK